MNTFIIAGIVLTALMVMLITMWGVGKAEAEGDNTGKDVAGGFYAVGLITFIIGVSLGIFIPDTSSMCL